MVSYGVHGGKANVFKESRCYRVEWRREGSRKRQSFPKTTEGLRDAKSFAEGIAFRERHTPDTPSIGLRELWVKYTASRNFTRLREKTQEVYANRWVKWERFMGHQHPAGSVTQDDLDAFHMALAEQGTAPNQIGAHIGQAKMVHAWGKRRRLLAENDIADYEFRLGKDEHREEPEEYSWDEFERIIEHFNPQNAREWRRSAVIMLLGHQGVRERAALHLRWKDLDLERGVVTWPAQFDKMGKTWTQPMRDGTRSALFTSLYWRAKQQYTGPWVFWSPWGEKKRKGHEVPGVYGAQALWKGGTTGPKRSSKGLAGVGACLNRLKRLGIALG